MATTVNVNSNYAGKVAGEIIGASFREADTISKGLVTLFPNLNGKLNMRKIAYTDGTTAYSCGFDPAGTITLSEKILDPVKLKNDIQICKEDFRATWSGDTMGASAKNNNAPADIMEAIQVEVLASTSLRTDNLIWNGDAVNANEWDGFLTLWADDAAVIKAGSGIESAVTAVTGDTVEAAFATLVSAIPAALKRKDVQILVSPDVADAYLAVMVKNGLAYGLGGNANTQMVYGRYNIDVVNSLPDNTLIAYEKKNLVFGTGLMADHNELVFTDEDEIGLLTGLIRGKMVYNGGVQYYNGEDIVWYLTTAPNA